MALSIKNDEVDRLVRDLCSLTGESLTSAIEVALRERLSRVQATRESELQSAADWLQQQFKKSSFTSMQDFDEEMYDESGLPR